jgi:hypothetical protein
MADGSWQIADGSVQIGFVESGCNEKAAGFPTAVSIICHLLSADCLLPTTH